MFKTWKLVDLGEGLHQATLLKILKQVGDEVSEDQIVCELETEKSVIEIPSPYEGIIVNWHVKIGDQARTGSDMFTVFASRESSLGENPASIAIHNMRLIKPERLAQSPFESYLHFFEDVRRMALGFRGIELTRMSGPQGRRLLKVLYEIWSLIVDIRRYLRATSPASDTRKSILEVLDTKYARYLSGLRGVLDEAEAMMTPSVFIGSSSIVLPFAEGVQRHLSQQFACTLWKDNPTFALNRSTLDGLFLAIEEYDFGVFVLGPDDDVQKGKKRALASRDNVIFELGLFLGKLGRKRVFIIQARKRDILSDLQGIITARFDAGAKDVHAALGPACTQVRTKIVEEWAWPITYPPSRWRPQRSI